MFACGKANYNYPLIDEKGNQIHFYIKQGFVKIIIFSQTPV